MIKIKSYQLNKIKMKIKWSRLRRIIGYFCSIFGIILIIVGITLYLFGPTESGVVLWEDNEDTTIYVKPYEYSNYIYRTYFLVNSLVVNVHATITLDHAEKIKVYFMNKTLYTKFKNGTYKDEDIKNAEINNSTITFQPVLDAPYYIVLYNTLNETAQISIGIKTLYLVRNLDYGFAFKSLELAGIGGIIFVISFLFGNVFYELERRIYFKYCVSPRIGSEKVTPGLIIWIGLGIGALLDFYITQSNLNNIPSVYPPPVIPLRQDFYIRVGLLVFLLITLFSLVCFFAFDLFSNLIYRLLLRFSFGRHYYLMIDRELYKKFHQILTRKMFSSFSIIVYLVILILGISLWSFMNITSMQDEVAILLLLLPTLVPFVLLFTYNFTVAIRDISTTEDEYIQIKRRLYALFVSLMLTFLLVIGFWHILLDLFYVPLYSVTISSSMLIISWPRFGETIINETFISGVESLHHILSYVSGLLIGITLIMSSFPLLNYFFDPTEVKISKKQVFLKEMSVFILTFITMEIILLTLQQSFIIFTPYALATALAYSILRYYISTLWKTLVQKPRFCPKCKKDLSSFPQDIKYCPYCKEKLN